MDSQQKIQELQITEQNLQSIMSQKQNLQVEIQEVENALSEVKKTSGDIYKLVSQIMVKSEKEKVSKDLEESLSLKKLRLDSLEKQFTILENKSKELREEVTKSLSN